MRDNWCKTIFTDETAFDLFRNKVCRWHKSGKNLIRRLPKSRQKVMAWGGISRKGKTPLFCFTNIMDGPFYVHILQSQLLPAAQSMYQSNWRLQQDNDPKHTSRVAKDFVVENGMIGRRTVQTLIPSKIYGKLSRIMLKSVCRRI